MTPEERALVFVGYVAGAVRDIDVDWNVLERMFEKGISQAIEAEREECAKVAESAVARYYVEHIDDDIDIVDATPAYKACEEIRDAIRNRP